MSLRWYRRPRLVVLNSNSTVQEAARAIEQNRIGAVVVQDKRRVVGIVTDRDLAMRALGRGLDTEINEASIQAELGAQLDVDPTEAARILAAVAGVIAGSISDGQAEHVRGQLQPGLRDVFRENARTS